MRLYFHGLPLKSLKLYTEPKYYLALAPCVAHGVHQLMYHSLPYVLIRRKLYHLCARGKVVATPCNTFIKTFAIDY